MESFGINIKITQAFKNRLDLSIEIEGIEGEEEQDGIFTDLIDSLPDVIDEFKKRLEFRRELNNIKKGGL